MGYLNKDEVIRFLAAAADPVRLEIVFMLAEQGRMNVGEIAGHFRQSRPAISHHLKVLKDAGLLRSEKQGQEIGYWLDHDRVIAGLQELIDELRASKAQTG